MVLTVVVASLAKVRCGGGDEEMVVRVNWRCIDGGRGSTT